MVIVPTDGKVLLAEPTEEAQKRLMEGESKLYIAPKKEEYKVAEVVALGANRTIPGDIKYDPPFEAGDLVLYATSMAQSLRIGGKNYLLIDYPYIGGRVHLDAV